jgi:hypothetical protein
MIGVLGLRFIEVFPLLWIISQCVTNQELLLLVKRFGAKPWPRRTSSPSRSTTSSPASPP